MWGPKNDQPMLDRLKVRADFRIVSKDNFHLVCPKKNVWDWESDEKWLRSVVVGDDGAVVSCGWPKFGNYGEFENDTKVFHEALAGYSEVLFTHKHDGSLCIRSVFGGKVVLRTRGTIDGGEYDEEGNEPFGVRFNRAAKDLYPRLLDPTWHADKSLLFEYVSPNNKIVVRYSKDDLIFLGFVYHNLTIGTWPETMEIASDGNLNLVELHVLPMDCSTLLAEIKDWEDEGVVVRCNGSQTFVKIKSATYLYKHRIKHNMKYNFIVEFIGLANIESEEQLVEELSKDDLDYEIVQEGVVFYRMYQSAVDRYDDLYNKALVLMTNFSPETKDPTANRKEFAMIACRQEPLIRSIMFALYSDKRTVLRSIRQKLIVAEGKSKK